MTYLYMFVGSFLIIYLFSLLLLLIRKNKMEKYHKAAYLSYLVGKYKLNLKKINLKKLIHTLSLTNAFIIALTVTIIGFVEIFIFKVLIGFAIVMILIIIIYDVIGKNLKKKGFGKDV